MYPYRMVIEKRPPFAPPSFFRILQGLATCVRPRPALGFVARVIRRISSIWGNFARLLRRRERKREREREREEDRTRPAGREGGREKQV